jgi:succinate dehydrogenase hydrophobic anchor subunit
MLITLLAILSSTALLTCAMSAANVEHVGPGGYLLAAAIGLFLAVLNFWMIRKVARLLADSTSSLSQSLQEWVGKAFFLLCLIWIVCTGAIGFWVTSAVALHLSEMRH